MNQSQTDALGTAPVGKLFVQLATPAIAAQVINLLYNLVDRMYIGHMTPVDTVGRLALTGVGVCLPVILIVSAFAALFGVGAAPRASILLGKGDKKGAELVLGNSVTALVTVAILSAIVLTVWGEEILMAFGASPDTIGYATDYLKIYALGTIFVQLTLGMNPFISGQGFTKISMLTILIGAVSNIILDPIFIFGFKMGVSGAALATILSQSLSMIWSMAFLMGKKTTIAIKKCNLRPKASVILASMALGAAPFTMSTTESLVAVVFNTSLQKFGGDIAVGTMTILSSAMQLSMLPLSGLTQGAQPIISYNYGAGNVQRVRKAFGLLLKSCLIYSFAFWVAVQTNPSFFVKIFNNDPALVSFASRALRIYMGGTLLFGAQIACQQSFMALGLAKEALSMAMLRKVILLVPLIYIVPMFMADKTTAVFLAEPITDVLAVIATLSLFRFRFRAIMGRLEH